MKNILRVIFIIFGFIFYRNIRSKVIYYHDIHDNNAFSSMSTPMKLFKKHIGWIKVCGFEIVSQITKPHYQIQIVFDDGFRGIYENRNWLITNNIFPTIFVPTNLIGAPNYLSTTELIELYKLGFNIQSHAVSHTNLTQFSLSDLDIQLNDSKKTLKLLINNDISEICFPQGFFSDLVCQRAIHCGYKKLYISIPGGYYDYLDKKIVCRNIVQFANFIEFLCILYGGLEIFIKRYRRMHYQNN